MRQLVATQFARQVFPVGAVLLGATLLLMALVPPQEAHSTEIKNETAQKSQQQQAVEDDGVIVKPDPDPIDPIKPDDKGPIDPDPGPIDPDPDPIDPIKPPDTGERKCPEGQEHNEAGECVPVTPEECPEGTYNDPEGKCRELPEKCPDGSYKGGTGAEECCPEDQERDENDKCVEKPKPCPEGQEEEDGKCGQTTPVVLAAAAPAAAPAAPPPGGGGGGNPGGGGGSSGGGSNTSGGGTTTAAPAAAAPAAPPPGGSSSTSSSGGNYVSGTLDRGDVFVSNFLPNTFKSTVEQAGNSVKGNLPAPIGKTLPNTGGGWVVFGVIGVALIGGGLFLVRRFSR